MKNLGLKTIVKTKLFLAEKKDNFKKYMKDNKGQASIEYGIIVAVIVLLIIGALLLFGEKIAAKIEQAQAELLK